MGTEFCSARVDIGSGRSLFLDGNSKITGANGTYAEPAPNALSLPAASVSGAAHCPGSTAVCRASCYVRGLAANVPELYARYAENADALTHVLAHAGRSTEAAARLASWIVVHARHGFRWHVSGDVRDLEHARWIVKVALLSPGVPHWIYTRTLEAVRTLCIAPNLAVNVSADQENYGEAFNVARENGARLCYTATAEAPRVQLEDGSVIFPDYALRGRALAEPTSAPWWQSLPQRERAMVCPADFFGQSESARCGPCRKCLVPA